ncbi:obscurin-like [Misgurnus anguillicaudatus]|uniref:obscurin-like n=1 Tax=Misgurnus anguillicaudatus TaxID=75329 RepID=UPI003CCF2245
MEGDSVTLHANITEIQSKDVILWMFGPENSLIAKINGVAKDISITSDVLDGRFRDRLQVNDHTGDLTITDTTSQHTGLYHMIIGGRQKISYIYNVTVYGVFDDTDEVKSVSVVEEDSVTLHTHLTKIQKNDVIVWRFGLQKSLIARINGVSSEASIYPDVLDGRFRDRLQVNDQTGDLIIRDTKPKDSGLYEMIFNSAKESSYRFNVTVYGVFGDKVKSVSVMEGDSVTLQSYITKLQTDDLILWRFGPENSLIARINGVANKISIYDDVLDGRFRDRLQVNNQTGDLTITNITTQHTGLYITISGKQKISYRVNVIVYGVFCDTDEVKSVSVVEEDSVTLHTHLTKIQKNDVILWRFGLQKSLIAKINRATSEISIYDDVLDGRFRDRLQVNNQTGDLTITNITTKHSGLYEMIINSTKEISYKFNVTVYGE